MSRPKEKLILVRGCLEGKQSVSEAQKAYDCIRKEYYSKLNLYYNIGSTESKSNIFHSVRIEVD